MRLHAYLTGTLPFRFRITIADNASTDGTWAMACSLAQRLPHVVAVHLAEKGRGRALRQVWSTSDAAVLAYMDVDLSTDLAALLPLVAPLVSGHSDLSIGTRLARGAHVVRGAKREVISRLYNLLLHATLAAPSPTPSAVSRPSGPTVPGRCSRSCRTRDGSSTPSCCSWPSGPACASPRSRWTGSTTPTRAWTCSTPPSATCAAWPAWCAVWCRGSSPWPRCASRPRSSEPSRPGRSRRAAARFCAVGVVSTLAYVVLYVLLRQGIGAQPANALALLATAVANTAVNRRITFGVRTRTAHVRHQAQGLVVFGVGLALTSGALALLHATDPAAGRLPPRWSSWWRRTSPPPCCASSCSARGSSTGPPPVPRPSRRHHQERMMTTDVLPTSSPSHRPTCPRTSIRTPHPGRVPACVAGAPREPPGPPALRPSWAGTALLYLWGLGAVGVGQLLLLRRRAGRHPELEGVLLRILRRRQLHHGGQAAGLVVGHGALGPHLRPQFVERPSCPRRSRGWRRSASSTPRCAGGSAPAPPSWRAPCSPPHPWPRLMFRSNNPDVLFLL